jgi:hypothetical protein
MRGQIVASVIRSIVSSFSDALLVAGCPNIICWPGSPAITLDTDHLVSGSQIL